MSLSTQYTSRFDKKKNHFFYIVIYTLEIAKSVTFFCVHHLTVTLCAKEFLLLSFRNEHDANCIHVFFKKHHKRWCHFRSVFDILIENMLQTRRERESPAKVQWLMDFFFSLFALRSCGAVNFGFQTKKDNVLCLVTFDECLL